MDDDLVVYKSNAVIEAGYQLSLNEQRVVLAAIGLVDPRKSLSVTDIFVLSAKDFCGLFEVSEKNAYTALIEVAERLFSRYVVIDKPDANWDKLKTHWISSVRYNKSLGTIAISFAQDIIPYLSQLKGSFTRYELKHIGNMTSTYGIRLYELLMQWKNKGSREVEIKWLKKQFELDNNYDRMYDLKKYVIEPAVKDINTHSNLTVSWEQRKTGRAVTHLIFTFSEKKQTPEEGEVARIAEEEAEWRRFDKEVSKSVAYPPHSLYELNDLDYEAMGYEVMPPPVNEIPPESVSMTATIALTEDQKKCREWARGLDFWSNHVSTTKGFLKCWNNDVEMGLQDQWRQHKAATQATPAAKPKTLEVWERQGFESQKEYDAFMYQQQMEKYKNAN